MIKYDTSIKMLNELIEKLMVLCNKIVIKLYINYDKEKTIRIHEKNDILLFKNKDEILTQIMIILKKLTQHIRIIIQIKNTSHSV